MTYASGDERVPGLFAVPRGQPKSRACLIYQGGLGSTKEQSSSIWPAVSQLGAATFTIDARGAGERASEKNPLERVVRDKDALARTLRETVIDLRRAVDYLTSTGECDRNQIGYLGISQGGLTGALLSGSDHRVRSTVLMVTGAGWRTILKRSRLLVPEAAEDPELLDAAVSTLAPLDPARWVARIPPRALLLVNGRRDQDTSAGAARNLRRAAGPSAQVIIYDGGHDPFRASRSDNVPGRVAAFLDRTLIDP